MSKGKSKGKNKFNIKDFFVRHCEKIILILIVPIALWIASWSMSYPPLEWKPEALTQSANDARTRVDSNDRTADDEEVVVFKYNQLAQLIKQPVAKKFYETPIPWRPSVFPDRVPRVAPPVFTVTNLRARSGIGAIQFRPSTTAPGAILGGPSGLGGQSSATMEKKGAQWIVLTGLIPVREQLAAYLDTFSASKGYDIERDRPVYAYYEVERCEVTEDGQSEWKKLPVAENLHKNLLQWISTAPEVVDPNFLAPAYGLIPMAYPLPPVLKKKFGNDVTQPTIPLHSELLKEDTEKLQKFMEEQKRLMEEYDPSALEEYRPGMTRRGSSRDGDSPYGGASPSSRPGSRMSSSFRRGASSARQTEAQDEGREVDHYLFRFFDFDVEEGKTYRYRVRLHLDNPNAEADAADLQDPSLSESGTIATDFSSESNAVTLGSNARVLAQSARVTKGAASEPSATVTVVVFDTETAEELYTENERVSRGSVVDFARKRLTVPEPPKTGGLEGGGPPTAPPRPPRGGGGRTQPAAAPENTRELPVNSGVCVVDIQGGLEIRPLLNNAEAVSIPGSLLLMESNGTLVIRSVQDDYEEIDQYKNPTTSTSPSYGASPYGDSMSPGGFEGMSP